MLVSNVYNNNNIFIRMGGRVTSYILKGAGHIYHSGGGSTVFHSQQDFTLV